MRVSFSNHFLDPQSVSGIDATFLALLTLLLDSHLILIFVIIEPNQFVSPAIRPTYARQCLKESLHQAQFVCLVF